MAGFGQSLGQALGAFAMGGNRGPSKAEMQGQLDGSKIYAQESDAKKSLAQALKESAETEQIQAVNASRAPGEVLRNAMTNYGIPQADVQAVEQFFQNGKLGSGYDTSADGMGPVMPQPTWAGKLPDVGRQISGVNNALTLGDKSVDNLSKASSRDRLDRMKDGVMAGQVDPMLLAKAQFAGSGDAPFKANEYGTLNNITGKLDETTGAARNLGNVRNAEAGKDNAQAEKYRQETGQNRRSGDNQIITDAQGNVTLVNKATGAAMPATYADGKTVGAKLQPGRGDKPLTEGQAKAVAFASRMENSISIIDDLAKTGTNKSIPGSRAGWGIGSAVNLLQPESLQQLDQAKRDFINANLRRESGAVITEPEFDNAEKQYFPQIGDGDKVVMQKAKNRRIALEGMKADIPASSGDVTGDVIKRSSGKPAQQQNSSIVTVTDDASYNALPSGTVFMTPDGRTKRKP